MDFYSNVIEKRDISKIQKLNKITSLNGYWDEVRKLTKGVSSDHSIHRWQCLAEIRYEELKAQEQELQKQTNPERPGNALDKLNQKLEDAKTFEEKTAVVKEIKDLKSAMRNQEGKGQDQNRGI